MKIPLPLLFALSLVSPPVLPATAEDHGLEIAREYDRRDAGFGDFSANMEMILINSLGQKSTRRLRAMTLEVDADGEGERRLLIFDQPPDVKGTVMLTATRKQRADDQWLYLPAVKRVKRIASNNKTGPFMGSEFAYEDFGSVEVEKYTYRFVETTACGEALQCYALERYPRDPDSGYSRQTVYIDQAEYRLWKVDYYDRKGALLKVLDIRDYTQYLDKYWRAHTMLMTNVQTGKKTILNWSDYVFKNGLGPRDFHASQLPRIR